MPRGKREVSGRTRRGSVAQNDASSTSRRALGDVSNKETAIATKGEPPLKTESIGLRRSKRNLNGSCPAESDHTTQVEPPPRRQSLRSAAREAQPTKKSTQRNAARRCADPSGIDADHGVKQQATENAAAVTLGKRSREKNYEQKQRERERKRMRARSQSKTDATEPREISNGTQQTEGTLPSIDILRDAGHGLQRHPFTSHQYTSGIAEHDQINNHDVQEVTKYVTDLFQRLYHAEESKRPLPYMDRQPELNGMMRSILIDWIVEVHMKFRLMPETLYLCVNIIDRYLSKVTVKRNRLQLVGVTALLIACKYEEIYPPEVKDCVYITDRAYTRQDVLDMEAHIVKTLKFQLTVPTGYPFLQRFLHIVKTTPATINLANYYMERMLQEHTALKFKPSLLAAAAVALALNNPDRLEYDGLLARDSPGVPSTLLEYSGFQIEEIVEASYLLEEKVSDFSTTHSKRELIAVKKKFESSRYLSVSSAFRFPKVSHINR